MTITPKVRKYRIGAPAAPAPQAESAPEANPRPEADQVIEPAGAPAQPSDTADVLTSETQAPGDKAPGSKAFSDTEDSVRAENLTGRQLRMARRMAQKHGIEVASDYAAVVELRRRGIDPFDRSTILSMMKDRIGETRQGQQPPAPPNGARPPAPAGDGGFMLPQTMMPGQLPALQVASEENRAREIMRIQRDIAQRRRRKQLMLLLRLMFFVFLPTLVAGWYYYVIATPLYATKTEFVIQKADALAGGGLSSLFSGTQLATNQDSVTVQSYLQSRDAMLRLDADQGFKAHFQQPWIDPIERLPPDASNEQAYKLYRRNVKIGYDPSEGVIKMEVIAADAQTSKRFSESLISYAEEQVDQLTARLRENQMRDARASYEDAEDKVMAAQHKVLKLQEQVGILDPASENSLVMTQVSSFETQLQSKRLELQQLMDNARPNQARVAGVKGDISRLEKLITTLRAQLTEKTGTTQSLASVSGDLRIAEAELATRQTLLAQAAQQMETARIEANKQVRYLEMGVRPIAPDEPTYPRAFENTLLAFLIFAGIYLMLSLTASILREQVSS